MSDLNYTTIDRIFNKLHRELKDTSLNETDIIDYVGEAMEFLRVYPILEEAVTFQKVENNETPMPKCTVAINQISRNINWVATEEEVTSEVEEEVASNNDPCETTDCGEEGGIPLNCKGYLPDGTEYAYYRPVFDLVWEYELWRDTNLYKSNYAPVRLSNHTFFNTLVHKDGEYDYVYNNCVDEYTIVGSIDKILRFSFTEGYVAISYLRTRTDPETGYPLIPDQISFISAITNYCKWKIIEWHAWNGRKGADGLDKKYERLWLKYAKQAKNFAKMPRSLDRYQNLFDQTRQIVPLLNKYNNRFKKTY